MMNMHLLNRSGLAAIAAATAFLTTPALAQDAAPVAADPAPIVADAPVPSEPALVAETAEPAAPAASAPVAKATATRAAKAPRAATVPNTAAPVKASPRTTAEAPVATAPVSASPAVEAPADPALVAPLPAPVTAAPVAQASPAKGNDTLPIVGAAGVGVLALAGVAFAMRRRRRDDDVIADDTWVEAQSDAPAPAIATSPPVATAPISAFAWGNPPAAPAQTGLSRIEAAKRGPTPDNPSASLKKRLARAAFFDQRDRQVDAGEAAPIDAMAGLPDSMDPVVPEAGSDASTAGRPVQHA